ncbi:MAG: hypothetical protein GOV02_02940 [Candidatus Aenigmarchaeota archaeon]|nr:hypothetical protein [Candidatus Aenigmarchaeota archaeon]
MSIKVTFYSMFVVAVFLRIISKPKYDFDFLVAWAILCGIIAIILTIKDYYIKKKQNKSRKERYNGFDW